MKLKDIDTNIWVTQQELADELTTDVQRVHNWIARNKIDSIYIKELRITLVNKNTITARKYKSPL